MRSLFRIVTVIAAAWMAPLVAHASQEYFNATVLEVFSYSTTDNCVHFLLVGVNQADPVVPNNGWFAVSSTANPSGAKDAYAALLAAKINGTTMHIRTDGTISCGNATASLVSLD